MARPGKKSGTQLTPGQSAYVLERLIAERRVSKTDVNRYVSEMSQEIGQLERRLAALRAAAPGIAAAAGAAGAIAVGAAVQRRRRRGRKAGASAAPAGKSAARAKAPITAEQAASRKLQGRYLGLVRQFPPSRRLYFAKVAREKGRETAIKEMVEAKKK